MCLCLLFGLQELCRELTQPYGDPEPETEETQWCLTNSLAPYATVARTNVVPFFTMQEDKNDTEMEEVMIGCSFIQCIMTCMF